MSLLSCQVSLQQKLSGVELENKLLKREVSSLNDELGAALERVREAEEGVALQRTEMESLREQAATSERVIRQLRSCDEDTQATLEARDSQIQVSIGCPCITYSRMYCLMMWMCAGVEEAVARGRAGRGGLAGETGWTGKREGKVYTPDAVFSHPE